LFLTNHKPHLKSLKPQCWASCSILLVLAYDLPDQSKIICSLRTDQTTSVLRVTIEEHKLNNNLSLLPFISLLDWIFRAIRAPASDGISISSSRFYLSAAPFHELYSDGVPHADSAQLPFIKINFTLSAAPLPKVQDECWQPLFQSAFVVEGERPYECLRPFGRGLEMSFDLMTTLAGAEYGVMVNDGLVLTGYQTVLVPIEANNGYVQFHLEINLNGQINPHAIEYGERYRTVDYNVFKNMRCFVGWCENAQILLGTESLFANKVKYSGTQDQRRTLHLTGLSAGIQALSCGPIQAGMTGQANFTFITNRIRFSPLQVYSKMLRDTAKEVALVYDAGAKRSWLVPKLSLVLHMAHAWIKDNVPVDEDGDLKLCNPIPFAEPHFDGFAVVETLESAGDIAVCGSGDDALPLRTLLLGLNINLLMTSEATEPSSATTLYGFEFMDVVMQPGKGGNMKKITLLPEGQTSNWLRLADVVDIVVFCSDLGGAITPEKRPERKSERCNSLPRDMDWLAAHVSCLARLTKRFGGELLTVHYAPEVVISQLHYWRLSGDPFKGCKHDGQDGQDCWGRTTLLQSVRKKNRVQNFRAREISLSGAIVFGERITSSGFTRRWYSF
jgi:hypothetical protein